MTPVPDKYRIAIASEKHMLVALRAALAPHFSGRLVQWKDEVISRIHLHNEPPAQRNRRRTNATLPRSALNTIKND